MRPGISAHRQILLGLSLFILCACSTRPYHSPVFDAATFAKQSETKAIDDVHVTVAVAGAAQTREIFGLPLYDNGMQPVWLQVENKSAQDLRFAPVGTDRFYFSPLEVAWKYRGGYTKEAQQQMERSLHEAAMARYIPAGETRSGFVFTHASNGAKSFNIDLFGVGVTYNFTYLMNVPGFVADHSRVDFETIYPADEVRKVDENQLRESLVELGCCALNEDGTNSDYAINVSLLAGGLDLLYALLRANWSETDAQTASEMEALYFYGRKPDARFRYGGRQNDGYYTLRLWLAPITFEGTPVWVGQINQVIDYDWLSPSEDPDVDHARNFLLQNLWYAQALDTFGWLSGGAVVPVESHWLTSAPIGYFSDGYIGVFWVSGTPMSLMETRSRDWEQLPLAEVK